MVNVGASPPSHLTVIQVGPTSIDVSWTPPSPLGDTTGYIIYYSNDDNTDSANVNGTSTDVYTLTDLQNGETYAICIVATSLHLPSESVPADMTIGLSESNILIRFNDTIMIYMYSTRSTSDHCRLHNNYSHYNLWRCS